MQQSVLSLLVNYPLAIQILLAFQMLTEYHSNCKEENPSFLTVVMSDVAEGS